MTRDWTAARAKVTDEGHCRHCARTTILEAAHIVPRSRVTRGGEDARNIIPLCRDCHQAQHAGRLELLPLLSLDEQAYVVSLVGIEEARRRTTSPLRLVEPLPAASGDAPVPDPPTGSGHESEGAAGSTTWGGDAA